MPEIKKSNELTFKVIISGIVLSVILGAANTYLGLFAGLTICSAIPGVILGLGILKLFKKSNIYENNLIEATASAGGSLAGGVIFTVPALVMIGYWSSFDAWEITKISSLGGIIGILFSIPLRRALVVESDLKFPEGIAIATVLEASYNKLGGEENTEEQSRTKSKTGIGLMIFAACSAGLIKIGQQAFTMWNSTVSCALSLKGSVLAAGMDVSPALMAVGYIVGLKTSFFLFAGGILSWLILIPLYSIGMDHDTAVSLATANNIWGEKIRYIGVGALIVGGLISVFGLIKPLIKGVRASVNTYKAVKRGSEVSDSEKDIPILWALLGILLSIIPLLLYFYNIIDNFLIVSILAVSLLVLGFIFSSISAYMSGLMGTSSCPNSSIAIASIIFISFLMLLLLGAGSLKGAALAIIFGAIMCCASFQASDTLQDLKAGHMVGTTPWKLQIMQIVGTVAASLVLGITLKILDSAYTIGSEQLSAPQATLMKSIAQGVFERNLPWGLILTGVLIAVVVIIIDYVLKIRKCEFRISLLAFASGVYLPIMITSAFFVGGLIAYFADKKGADQKSMQKGLLISSGLIAGEALMGIVVAIPIFLSGSSNWWPHVSGFSWLGLVLFAFIVLWLYKSCSKKHC